MGGGCARVLSSRGLSSGGAVRERVRGVEVEEVEEDEGVM